MKDRGIDHLVLCVRNLDAARDAYGRMGFTLTPKALHPFGTANSLVQLQGSFLELLAVADPAKIAAPVPTAFGFAAFNRDFLEDGEGMSMLVFESDDADSDRREFAASGLSRWDPFDFERLARLPDGSEVTVGFSLTFVTHPDMARAGFFTCQQHAPQYFWKPEYQTHANTARAVSEVVMVAEEPHRYEPLFAGLQGGDAVSSGVDGLRVATRRGSISVLTPGAWRKRYGAESHPPLRDGPRFAAFAVAVADIDACSRTLESGGFAARRQGEGVLASPQEAFGVLIEFTPAAG